MCAKVVPVVQHKFYPTFKNIHFKYWTLKQHVVSTSGALPPVTRNFLWLPGCGPIGSQLVNFVFLKFWMSNLVGDNLDCWKLCFLVPCLDKCYLDKCYLVLPCLVRLIVSVCTNQFWPITCFRLFFDGKCSLVIEIHDVGRFKSPS